MEKIKWFAPALEASYRMSQNSSFVAFARHRRERSEIDDTAAPYPVYFSI